jgi:hypothetical protein
LDIIIPLLDVHELVGIWFPIFSFASLGFDHVVANMTFIPMGIWLGAAEITVGLYIWNGIIPTLLGNIVGGGLFAGRSISHLPWGYTATDRCRHVLLVHVSLEWRGGYSDLEV